MTKDWTKLDEQLRVFAPFIRDDLRIASPDSDHLASVIAGELHGLSANRLEELVAGDVITPRHRLDELIAFQSWMDTANAAPREHSGIVRAQVITQNYISFVYLGDALFKSLRKNMPTGSASKKCARFLTNDPVRAFRNAVAHANWCYLPDYDGLEFWARKGNDSSDPMIRFEVCQLNLDCWQMLARATAYVAYTIVAEHNKPLQ